MFYHIPDRSLVTFTIAPAGFTKEALAAGPPTGASVATGMDFSTAFPMVMKSSLVFMSCFLLVL